MTRPSSIAARVLASGLLFSAGAAFSQTQPPQTPPPAPPADVQPGETPPARPTEGEQPKPADKPVEPAVARLGDKNQPQARPATRVEDIPGFVGDVVTRLALLDLRSADKTTIDDFFITGHLLSIAETLRPKDAEVVRRRAEAAFNAGENDELMRATRRILELEPDDTVAQLRLITARIASAQTVADRLRLYDAFLGPKGESIDASVRSRLALDAALLSRERGDENGFVDRLKQAASLDSTNKDAALLCLSYYAEKSDEPLGKLDLLANLLLADPLDPKTCLALAEHLATLGAYTQARRFHMNAGRILAQAEQADDPDRYTQGLVLSWLTGGPKAAIDEVTNRLLGQRAALERAQQAGQIVTTGVNTVLRPEDIRLAEPMEKLRLCAALGGGEEYRTVVATSMHDLTLTLQDRIAGLEDRTRWPDGFTEDQSKAQVRDVNLELNLWRMLTGYEIEKVEADLPAILQGYDDNDPKKLTALAWQAVRRNDYAGALKTFRDHPSMGVWADLGTAVSLDATGDRNGAGEVYARLARTYPLLPIGGLAASLASGGKFGDVDSELARKATEAARAIPAWVDEMIDAPHKFELVRADVPSKPLDSLGRAVLKIRIKNISPVPLGVGSGHPINTRFFLAPSLEVGVRTRSDAATGEVLDATRRLRLLPGQELEVSTWAEAGVVGFLQRIHCHLPARLRWRVIQGFETRGDGRRDPGPGCVESTTLTMTREILPESALTPIQLGERLAASTEPELPALLVAARSSIAGLTIDSNNPESMKKLYASIFDSYPRWSPDVRLLAALLIPSAAQVPDVRPIDDLIRQDTDPRIQHVAIVTRVTSADDPLLAAAIASGNTELGAFAKAQQARIARGGKLLARDGIEVSPSMR